MIRAATPADIPEIHAMVRELAAYERVPDEARATGEQFAAALFGPDPAAHALIAQDDPAGPAAGYAIWYRTFSTWTGAPGLFLLDLYVRPHTRRAGHGRALLAALAAVCVERGYQHFEWSVLDWNEPALGLYRSVGAVPQDGWTAQRLSGPALHALAARAEAYGRGRDGQARPSDGDSGHSGGHSGGVGGIGPAADSGGRANRADSRAQ